MDNKSHKYLRKKRIYKKIKEKKREFSKYWRINIVVGYFKHYITKLLGGNLNEQS